MPQVYEMGDTGTAAALAAEHHDSLFRWARALANWDREEAMEIVQQTYMEVVEGRADLPAADDPKRFLFGVARRVAASRRRRRSIWGRVLRMQIDSLPPAATFEDPESSTDLGERSAKVKDALAKLPDRQAQVMSLVFMEGLTVEESARVMDVSVGSARTHYHRGKKKLKELLSGDVR